MIYSKLGFQTETVASINKWRVFNIMHREESVKVIPFIQMKHFMEKNI